MPDQTLPTPMWVLRDLTTAACLAVVPAHRLDLLRVLIYWIGEGGHDFVVERV